MTEYSYEPQILSCAEQGGIVIEFERKKVWSRIITRKGGCIHIKKIRCKELDSCSHPVEYPQGVAQAASRFLTGLSRIEDEAKLVLETIVKKAKASTTTTATTVAATVVAFKTYTRKDSANRAGKKLGEKFPCIAGVGVMPWKDEFAVGVTVKCTKADVPAELFTLAHVQPVDPDMWTEAAAEPQPEKAAKNTTENTTEEKPAAGKTEKKPAPAARSAAKAYTINTGADFGKRRGGYRLTLDAVASAGTGTITAQAVWEKVKATKPDYKLADIYSDLSVAHRQGYVTVVEAKA